MKTSRSTRLLKLLALSVLLMACGKGQTEIKPPEIRYDETECFECRMIINDPRFVAGYTYEVAEGRYKSVPFDDIGDMLNHAEEHPEHQIVAYWVHDSTTEAWLDAEDAFFVFSHHLETPMASGTVATEGREKAEQLAAENHGQVLDWDGLLTKHRAGELVVSLVSETALGGDGALHEMLLHGAPEASFPIEVAPSKLSSSFVASDDGSKLFLMVVSPQEAGVGLQPIEILVVEKESATEWPPVDGLTLEIVPKMPTMDHGSPDNEHPISGDGHYRGKVSFTMVGPWTVTVKVSRDVVKIGEVVFEYDVG